MLDPFGQKSRVSFREFTGPLTSRQILALKTGTRTGFSPTLVDTSVLECYV